MAQDSLNQALDLARRGSEAQAQARTLFLQILEEDPGNEEAWMAYINTLASNPERIKALKKYLQINPSSEKARQRLSILGKDTPVPPPADHSTQPSRPLNVFLLILCGAILLAGGYFSAGLINRPAVNSPSSTPDAGRKTSLSVTAAPGTPPAPSNPDSQNPGKIALPTLDVTLPPLGNPILEALVVFPVDLCSPIKNVPMDELGTTYLLDNYHPPLQLHSDARHQGVDLGYYTKDGKVGMTGAEIDSILPGKVAGVTMNRWPYGNQVVIETRYTDLSEEFSRALHLGPQYSLYHLYAHMDKAPVVQIGDLVDCGQQVGVAGTSGHSTVPHLHFETRIGPPGEEFAPMAYYDQTPLADPEEKHAYLYWRISGVFQHFDPLELFALYADYTRTKTFENLEKWKTPLPTGDIPTPEVIPGEEGAG